MKVRGDGRPYMLTISMDRFFDVGWFDQYHYTLFTHGGPYWQTAKVEHTIILLKLAYNQRKSMLWYYAVRGRASFCDGGQF